MRPDLLLRIAGGLGLFYRYRANYLYGPSEQGKSWLALCAAVQVLREGGRVLWADVDDMEDELIDRLLWLGAPREAFADGRLRVARPLDLADVREVIRIASSFDLVVVDAMGGLVPMVVPSSGGAAASNTPDLFVSVWQQTVKKTLRSRRTTVIVIDHTNKHNDLEDGPTGTATKLNGVRGSMIGVESLPDKAPVPGGKGYFSLWLFKDTAGMLRRDARDRGARVRGRMYDVGRIELWCTNPDDPEAYASLAWRVLPPLRDGVHGFEAAEVTDDDAPTASGTASEPARNRSLSPLDRVAARLTAHPGDTGPQLDAGTGLTKTERVAAVQAGLKAGPGDSPPLLRKEECRAGCVLCERPATNRLHYYLASYVAPVDR